MKVSVSSSPFISAIVSSLYLPYSIIVPSHSSVTSLAWVPPQGAVLQEHSSSMSSQTAHGRLTVLPGCSLLQHGLSMCCNFFELASTYSSWHVDLHGLWMDVCSTMDLHGYRKSASITTICTGLIWQLKHLLSLFWGLQGCSSYVFSFLFPRSCCAAVFTLF